MELLELSAELRDQTGKGVARQLRAKGRIPGVYYGPGVEPQPVSLDPLALRKIILAASGRSFLLNLKIGDQIQPVMLKDFQVHPVSRRLLHADFMRIQEDKPVSMEVSIELVGEPAGLTQGGILETQLRELELTGLPKDLPEVIKLDVSRLQIGDSLKVADLDLPPGVEVEADPEMTVCAVAAPSEVLVEAKAEAAEEAEGGAEAPVEDETPAE